MSDHRKHILIVDDEPNVRLVFRTTLETAGYATSAADDGETALRWLSTVSADLILLDLRMPGIGGMGVLESLRHSGVTTPVVIVTAHGSVPDAVAAMKLGAIDFLSKPLTPDTLRRVVADVLDREAPPVRSPGPAADVEPVTAASRFADNLRRAKRALNARWFDEADIFLRQATALGPDSAEAHNLMGVLHEVRGEHDASYRSYKAALKADARYEPAQHNMRRYYERVTFGRSEVPVDTGDVPASP
jgi:DNA-binding response OmpR family regulator